MRLSLRLSVPEEVTARAEQDPSSGPLSLLGPGTVVDVSVVAILPPASPDRVIVRVTHYYRAREDLSADSGSAQWERLLVPARDADDSEEDSGLSEDVVCAEVPLIQLLDCKADVLTAADAGAVLAAAIPPGTQLRGLIVLQRLSAKRQLPLGVLSSDALRGASSAAALAISGPPRLLLSKKPLLCAAVTAAREMLPSSIEHVHAGLPVVGYVASVTAFGAFVRFLSSCTGLCPRSKWPKHLTESVTGADGILRSKTNDYVVGDTVIAAVDTVLQPTLGDDSSRSRFTLTLQTGLVSKALSPAYLARETPSLEENGTQSSLAACFLQSWLFGDEIRRCAAPGGSGVPARAAYPIGARLVARVDALKTTAAAMQLRLPAPPPLFQTSAVVADFPAVAVHSESDASAACAVGDLVSVCVVDVSEGAVFVTVIGPAPPPVAPLSSKKAKKGSNHDASRLPLHFSSSDIAQVIPDALSLGSVQDVEVS
jgi:hypothetical protein